MKNNIKKKKILKNIGILAIVAYVIYILINQQITLNYYDEISENFNIEMEEAVVSHEDLELQKSNIESPEFIEKMAREKLDMYYPNEKIYINNGK